MRKFLILATIVAVLAVFGAACGQPTPQTVEKVVKETVVVQQKVVQTKEVVKEKQVEVVVTATPVPGEEVVTADINWGTEPPTADPALATDTTSSSVIGSIFMGLTDLDDKTQKAVPSLATDWEASDDNTVWTFHLRDDVPWVKYNPTTGEVEQVKDADGNPRMVTAQDVVYGVKRTIDPRTASDYAYIMYIIKGAEDLNTADPAAENFQELLDSVGVEAVDDHTVKFTLEYGAGFFPQITSMSTTYAMPQWVIEDKGERWIEPGFIATNGAYVMKSGSTAIT